MKTLSKIASERWVNAPVLNTILVRDGLAHATNMDQYITYKTDIVPGLYNGKAFDQVQIPCSDIPESDFPECSFRLGDKLSTMVLPREALEFVFQAASTEETRYYLNGILFDPAGLVATNGHILLCERIETGLSEGQGVILPNAAIKFLLSIMKEEKTPVCELDIHKTGFVARCGRYTMTSKSIDGTLPDYRRVIPQDAPCVGLVDGSIAAAYAASKAVYKGLGLQIKYTDGRDSTPWRIEKGSISIAGHPPYKWPCALNFHEPCGFNPTYLSLMPEGTAYSKGPADPMRIDAGARTGVIMPTRL